MDFNKPEYLYNPSSMFRRDVPSGEVSVLLPWGVPITVKPSDDLGRAIYRKRVYDLPVTEALWRLTDAGEVAFDVGANLGYMSAVLAARSASVYAFEPHPAIYARLKQNAARWPNVTTFRLALSDRDGTLRLTEPPPDNDGMAKVSEDGAHVVEARRLDSLGLPVPHVLKVDVEFYELEVLRGAGKLLGQVRDIVFEDFGPYPTPAAMLLESAGYSVFNLGVSLTRPLLCPPCSPRSRSWEPPSYLATLEPDRARQRFGARGWQCLSSR